MPTVYGANASPFVRKVRVFLAEKKIAYDLEPVIPAPGMRPEGYFNLHPMGKVPAFRDGDRTLADSSVICAYLERTHAEPALYPSDAYEYARALWFEEYSDTAIATGMTGPLFFEKVVGPRFFNHKTDEAVVEKALKEGIPRLCDYLESQLGNGDWLVGNNFSIADIGIASQFVNARHAGYKVDASRWPKLAKHVDRAHARPSFKALIEEEVASFGQVA